MSKIIYPDSEGIYPLVENMFNESITCLKNAQSFCSYSISSNFSYLNYLKDLPNKVQGYLNDANEIVSKSKEIDNSFKLTMETLKDKCSSLDVSILETRDRLVK